VDEAASPRGYALMTHAIDRAIFDVARGLEVPVLILALLALAAVIVELGAFAIELRARRRRHFPMLATTAAAARASLERGDRDAAVKTVVDVAWSSAMVGTLETIASQAGLAGADTRLAKSLADFDFDSQRRLGRTRLLVRAGPALGLMGTLIPLSPALSGLAKGNISQLSQNLRVAFSVTVLGLLIGAVAYGLSLYRDRIYGQDLSDLEYVAAVLTDADVDVDVTASSNEPAAASEAAPTAAAVAGDDGEPAIGTARTPAPFPIVSNP
jgi:biopolymer transport protein ExbB/TolQ